MVKLGEFVTINQAARFLHMSANTLRNWHRDAKIPVCRNPVSELSAVQASRPRWFATAD
jgi:DNA-binding transcriptional regulator YiaG